MIEISKRELKTGFEAIVYHPIAIGTFVGILLVGGLYLSGIIMRILTGTVSAYKGLKGAINKPA